MKELPFNDRFLVNLEGHGHEIVKSLESLTDDYSLVGAFRSVKVGDKVRLRPWKDLLRAGFLIQKEDELDDPCLMYTFTDEIKELSDKQEVFEVTMTVGEYMVKLKDCPFGFEPYWLEIVNEVPQQTKSFFEFASSETPTPRENPVSISSEAKGHKFNLLPMYKEDTHYLIKHDRYQIIKKEDFDKSKEGCTLVTSFCMPEKGDRVQAIGLKKLTEMGLFKYRSKTPKTIYQGHDTTKLGIFSEMFTVLENTYSYQTVKLVNNLGNIQLSCDDKTWWYRSYWFKVLTPEYSAFLKKTEEAKVETPEKPWFQDMIPKFTDKPIPPSVFVPTQEVPKQETPEQIIQRLQSENIMMRSEILTLKDCISDLEVENFALKNGLGN